LNGGGSQAEADQAFRDATVEKRIAVRQLAGLYATSGVLAGVGGMPLIGIMEMLWNMFMVDDDEENAEELLSGSIGEGAYSGLINYVTGTDVAGRIGLTNMLYRTMPNREQTMPEQIMEFAGGPVLGMSKRVLDGMEFLAEGEVQRGAEKMLPAAFSNMMKSARYATEGANTLRGDPIVEEVSWNSMLGQFLGFTPVGYSRQLERNAVNKRIDNSIKDERTGILRRIYLSRTTGHTLNARRAGRELQDFNRRHPEAAITSKTIQRSMTQHAKTSEMARGFGGATASRAQYQRMKQRNDELLGNVSLWDNFD